MRFRRSAILNSSRVHRSPSNFGVASGGGKGEGWEATPPDRVELLVKGPDIRFSFISWSVKFCSCAFEIHENQSYAAMTRSSNEYM